MRYIIILVVIFAMSMISTAEVESITLNENVDPLWIGDNAIIWENTKSINISNVIIEAPKEVTTCSISPDSGDGWDNCTAYITVYDGLASYTANKQNYFSKWAKANEIRNLQMNYTKNITTTEQTISIPVNDTYNHTYNQTIKIFSDFAGAIPNINKGDTLGIKMTFQKQSWTHNSFNLSATFEGNTFTLDPDVTACGTLSSAGTYTLTQNINSSGTCITIGANNVTLDGQGYWINYSQSGAGYAIIDSGGYDNITIKNLNIVQGSTSSNSYAIYFSGASNGTIQNNTITTSGSGAYGALLSASSDYNTLSNNTILTTNTTAYGVYLLSSSSNNITGGSIIAQQSYDYYLDLNSATNTNNFTGTNFTARRWIYFQDTSTWFNYNNQTDGNIWLKNSLSAAGSINRTLATWSQATIKWNDTASVELTANYNLTGLYANKQYRIWNTSLGTTTNPYNITTDGNGALGFTIILNSNTEIILGTDTTPPTFTLNSTNSTLAGTDILHSLFWTDNIALSGYIFSFGNGSNWTQSDQTPNIQSEVVEQELVNIVSTNTGLLNPSTNGALVTGFTNPTNAYLIDATNYATGTIGIASWYGGYNPNIPADSIITGITVRSVDHASANTGTNQMAYKISNNSGTSYLSPEWLTGDVGTSDQDVSKGNDSYLWGMQWTVTNANGITVNATSGATSTRTMSLDGVQVNIGYTNNVTDSNETYDTENMVFNGTTLTLITNITFIINISSYNKTLSTLRANSLPDIWLEAYNGTDYITLGAMSISGTGNFSNSTQNAQILLAWQNKLNRNFRMKGINLDNNITHWDEINRTQEWVKIDSKGLFKNDSWVAFTGIGNWSNVTKSVNATVGANISWQIFANDSSNNWNVSRIYSYLTTSASDTTPPTFSSNSTNGTVAGTQIKHSLLAADNTALSGYIFSFDNGTGLFVNDTWAAFGATGWNNVSKGANETIGSTIRWFVWANDTSNNKNQSQIYSYVTTGANSCACPAINTNWAISLSDYCIINSDCNLNQGNITFTGNGNVTCNAQINSFKTDFGYILNNSARMMFVGTICDWWKP